MYVICIHINGKKLKEVYYIKLRTSAGIEDSPCRVFL